MIDMNNRKQVIDRLKELKEMKLPHMSIESLSEESNTFKEIIKEASEEEKSEIEKYLSDFYDDTKEDEKIQRCVFTKQIPILSWGLVHGVAIDNNTGLGWPNYHYFVVNGKRTRYERAMQYHPDGYNIAEKDEE